MALTYSQLSTAMQEYLQNTETSFVSNIPVFVRQAEERIYRSVQLPVARQMAVGTVTQDIAVMATPSGFLAPYSFGIFVTETDFRPLLLKDEGFILEAFPDIEDHGVPRYYALYNSGYLLFGPTPDAAYSCRFSYFAQPTSIVTAGTSWLGTNAESALLYGCLLEAYTYMKGEQELMTLYQARYAEALDRLKNLGEGFDRVDSYRAGDIAIPRS